MNSPAAGGRVFIGGNIFHTRGKVGNRTPVGVEPSRRPVAGISPDPLPQGAQGNERAALNLYDSGSLSMETEQTLAVITAAVRDAVVMVDGLGRAAYWNPAAEAMFGYRASEIMGRPVQGLLVGGGEGERMEELLREFQQTGRGEWLGRTVQLTARRGDGSEVPVELSLSPTRINGQWYLVAVIRDISDRISAELEMKRTLTLLRTTVEAIAEGLLVTDNHGRIVDHNRRFAEMWGFAEAGIGPEEDQAGLEHILSLLKDPQTFIDRAREVIADHDLETSDMLELTDGRILERYSRPMVEDGAVIGRVWSFHDVTDRLRAETELADHRDHLSEEVERRTAELSRANALLEQEVTDRIRAEEDHLRFKAMADNAGVLIGLADLKGRLIYLNRAGREMVGLEDEAGALAVSITDFVTSDQAKDRIGEVIRQVMDHGQWKSEAVINHFVTGRAIEVHIDVFLVTHPTTGDPLYLGAVIRDISDLMEAQRRAVAGEATVRSLMNAINEAVFVIGPWGEVIEANARTAARLGLPVEAIIGRNLLSQLPDRLAADMQSKIIDVLRSGRTVRFEDEREDEVTHYTISAIFDGDGKVSRLAVLGLDVTQLVQAKRVIEKKSEELSRSNSDLEQFAYAASHDLQEPLRAIVGYLDLLIKKHSADLDEGGLRYVGKAKDASGRMVTIIQDLLDYSRVGTRGKEFSPVDLARVVEEARGMVSRAAREAEAEVIVGPLPTVMADDSQMVMLFQNLISNAVKFRAPDRPPRVRIGSEEKDGQQTIFVEDNGIGIESDNRSTVFNIFVRLHSRQEYQGTGIGLAVCKRIVDRHGGSIRVEAARSGPGCRFVISLPVEAAGD